MVACLPLVQQVRGSIPGGVVIFHLKILNLGARRGGDVHCLIARCTSQAWIKFQTLPQYYMLRSHVVLLIAIRPSDGDVKPGGPLAAFREEQAMNRHRVSPSLFLSSSSHTNTTLHYSSTYSHPNLNFLHYADAHHTRNVVCPSGALFENRPHSMPSIRIARNPKHVIVQWVGIGTDRHFSTILPLVYQLYCCTGFLHVRSPSMYTKHFQRWVF